MDLKPLVPLLMVSLLGCGSPAETEQDPAVVACSDYCAAAEQHGCSEAADCNKDCLALFELGCATVLIDLLECATPALGDDCVPRDEQGVHACASDLSSYDNCVPVDFGGKFTGCGASVGQSDGIEPACVGSLQCNGAALSVACDEGGECVCSVDGAAVGTCTNIMASAYFCPPHAGCCAAVFASE